MSTLDTLATAIAAECDRLGIPVTAVPVSLVARVVSRLASEGAEDDRVGAAEDESGGRAITLGSWARIHGFATIDDAAVYLNLDHPAEVTMLTRAPCCDACDWPLVEHDPVWGES